MNYFWKFVCVVSFLFVCFVVNFLMLDVMKILYIGGLFLMSGFFVVLVGKIFFFVSELVIDMVNNCIDLLNGY